MNQFFLIGADYLKGKSIYNHLRRALNLLFNGSIASFYYELFYCGSSWLDIGDCKGILNFLIRGYFFRPLSSFRAVYGVPPIASRTVVYLLTGLKTGKWAKAIIE